MASVCARTACPAALHPCQPLSSEEQFLTIAGCRGTVDIVIRYRTAILGSCGLKEFLRGAVRLHILHHAAEHEIHGAWMANELEHHGYRISPGTLYPTLHRMAAEGLLTSRSEVVDGRARKLYRITADGQASLAEGRRALTELAAEVLPGNDDQEAPL
jgi:DNA-binding PadR family transcriptional regulator